MKVFITRYALSNKIIQMDGMIVNENIFQPYPTQNAPLTRYYKPDWHITMQSAIDRAEKMRDINISNLMHQIDNPNIAFSTKDECINRINELKLKSFKGNYLKPEILATSRSESDFLNYIKKGNTPKYGSPCNPPKPGGR